MNPSIETIQGGRSYRARKQRPCDACRRRKICCVRDDGSTSCSLCHMRSERCTYVSAPNVRRRRNPGKSSQNSSEDSPQSRVSDRNKPDQIVLPSLQSWASRGDDVHTPDIIIQNWIPQFVGFSGDQNPSLLRHCLFDNDRYRTSDWECLRMTRMGDAHFVMVPDAHLDAHPPWYPQAPAIGPSSEVQAQLLDTYFAVIHNSFPILDPALIKVHELEANKPLLGAMCMLANPFARQNAMTGVEATAWCGYMHQSLAAESRYPRIETFEAGLLWLQRHTFVHRTPTMPGLWSDIGSFLGMAHELGLNVDPTEWTIDVSQKNRRIRIAWGLFILEKWCALGLGRPSLISSHDWNVPVVTVAHFSDEVNSEHGWGTSHISAALFVAMANLSVILSDMLPTFYSLNAQASLKFKTNDELLSLVREYEGRLYHFRQAFLYPIESLVQGEQNLDPTGTLFLAYHTLQAVLYRAVLLYVPSDTGSYVRQQAKSVLLSAVDFTAFLKESQLRAFWWSPFSRVNFAILGSVMYNMLFSSTDEDEIEFWTVKVGEYRQLLESHSLNYDVTKLAIKRLDKLAPVTGRQAADIPFLCEDVWEKWVQF